MSEDIRTEKLTLVPGDETIDLIITEYGHSKKVYINLHENEQTSVATAHAVLSKSGGTLLELKWKGERLISFTQNDTRYTFDPNRIFSVKGIRNTLNEYGKYDTVAAQHVANFANAIINKILAYNPEWIVALHNTTGDFAMDSFMKGGACEKDMAGMFMNPQWHPADFFFTTDPNAFNTIKKGAYNVVLQNNEAATDDGSLSVYCARNGLKYINVEALHGHTKEQTEMIGFIDMAVQ